MIDFRKKLSKKETEVKVNPVEIYETLDRRSITGPLRPAQKEILDRWFNERLNDKDLIVKLHTGEGKTLIGLLMLQSKINSTSKPCLYVCPNKYLVDQVCVEAKKFGIPFCTINSGNDLPNDFLNGSKILITHVQKVFNGKSIFGTEGDFIEAEGIVLDDSHSCIDSIKNSFTITIKKENPIYKSIKSIFEDELRSQGEGSFLEIENGSSNTLLPIPYWAWIEKKSEITQILSSHSEEQDIMFAWPILKNSLELCQAFITSNELEISPTYLAIRRFPTFYKANQRILMSATTQDDSFFIKGLSFDIDSVKSPLINQNQRWSGEKMVLLPSLIDDNLNRELIIDKLAPTFDRNYGIVALVSSFRKGEVYHRLGGKVSSSKNIFNLVTDLKNGTKDSIKQCLVIVNRYDGIDLPDDSCRILIVDSMPYFNSLSDKYEELCRGTSDIINIKIAQKVEQGLGRSVRGEKDYTVILIIGADLVKFVKSIRTNKFFSEQTLKQIDIGLQIAEMAKEELVKEKDNFTVVRNLIRQSLKRDEGWKDFYKEEMDKIIPILKKNDIYQTLQLEKEAEEAAFRGNFDDACLKIQKILDNHIKDTNEQGWYLQILARYKFLISKTESNNIQKSAFQSNLQLLKPKDGINYKKIQYINENRIKRIKIYLTKFSNYDELLLSIDSILNDLSFGVEAEKFEHSLWEVGNLLGFISQRPDKEFRKGPDNLWCGVNNKYFMFECKSEVDDSREEINKHEAGQMNSHCGWFEAEYDIDSSVTRVLIIPTKNLSYYANFTHEVVIIRKGKLRTLKNNIKSFIKEFKSYNITEISDSKIQMFINSHKLNVENFHAEYTEPFFHKKHQ